MLRRKIALILALLLAVTSLPAAMASGSYSAHTPLSSADDDKLTNLRLAAQAIDGMTVPAGDSFSFNQTVGPREKRRGYREATNGRGVVVTGGGVAQAASTLYMALLQMGDDVDIDPVKTYGNRFSDDYVQNPSLAIVTDYDAGIDLSFTNLGDDDLSIDMWLGDDDLWCVVTAGREGGMGSLRDKNSGSSLFFLEEDEDAEDDAVTDSDVPSARSGGGSRIEVDDEDEEEDEEAYEADLENVNGGPVRPYGHDGLDSAPNEALGSACINCGGDKDVLHNVKIGRAHV